MSELRQMMNENSEVQLIVKKMRSHLIAGESFLSRASYAKGCVDFDGSTAVSRLSPTSESKWVIAGWCSPWGY